jgi:hypothetical protein
MTQKDDLRFFYETVKQDRQRSSPLAMFGSFDHSIFGFVSYFDILIWDLEHHYPTMFHQYQAV